MLARSWLKSILVAAFVSTAMPAVAFADDAGARTEKREGKAKGKDRAEAQFPMKAADFKERAEKRIAKIRERVTQHLAERGATADEQKKVLAKFDEGAAKVRAAVDGVTKDGTVTREEAKSVRKVAKDLRPKHAKGHKKGKGKGKEKGGKSDA